MKNTWTEKDIEFLKAYYPANGTRFCAIALQKTIFNVKSKVSSLKIKFIKKENAELVNYTLENAGKIAATKIARKFNVPKSRVFHILNHHKIRTATYEVYSASEIEYLKANLGTLHYADIAKHLGRTKESVRGKARTLNLKRTEEELFALRKQAGLKGGFQKGHVPHTLLFDGAVTIRYTKGTPYKYIRISKNIWQELHIHNWVKANGAVPEGKILRSVNGDTLNCDPDNWVPVLRSQHLELNSGSQELTDKYIINMLTMQKPELKEDIAQMPELIHLKRNQLKINRVLNENRSK
jgi:hypothetical protein